MADHRKSFRPRRLGNDGRHLPRGRSFGAALALLGALILAPAPVFAQEIGLTRGEASLNAGDYEAAVRQLSATVNDGKSTLAQASKALYLRGIAYRKLGMAGRAVSDLGAAVWLGLPPSDKARALVNKGLAYRAAGLTSQADAALAEARKASSAGEVERLIAKDGSTAVASSSASSDIVGGSAGQSMWDRVVPSFGSSSPSSTPPAPAAEEAPPAGSPPPTQTAEAAPSTGWSAEVQDESAQPSGNAVSRWFGSLAGDSAPAPPPPPVAANPVPPPAAATETRTTTASRTTSASRTAAAAPPSAASWAENTQTERVASDSEGGTAVGRWFSRQTSSAPAPAPAASQPSAGYTVQLANSRSKPEAEALWKKAQGSNSQLASAGARIEEVNIGSFGTFYSVKIGPFPSQSEGTKVCNALKRGGTDCSVVSPDGP